jgi:hypothetical protein
MALGDRWLYIPPILPRILKEQGDPGGVSFVVWVADSQLVHDACRAVGDKNNDLDQ